MKIKSIAKFWDVRFSKPVVRHIQGKDYQTSTNIHVMVAATSAQLVAQLVMAEYPDATIHQINHRGGDRTLFTTKTVSVRLLLMAAFSKAPEASHEQ